MPMLPIRTEPWSATSTACARWEVRSVWLKTTSSLSDCGTSLQQRGLPRRNISDPEELTSRIESWKIPSLLKKLDNPFPRGKSDWPVDVLLATNMISVGVDIDRLGLMVVTGQPKTTAEYIQATSRVGRKHPGLVITMYNWMGARDLSHYERFESYHFRPLQICRGDQCDTVFVSRSGPRASRRFRGYEPAARSADGHGT